MADGPGRALRLPPAPLGALLENLGQPFDRDRVAPNQLNEFQRPTTWQVWPLILAEGADYPYLLVADQLFDQLPGPLMVVMGPAIRIDSGSTLATHRRVIRSLA